MRSHSLVRVIILAGVVAVMAAGCSSEKSLQGAAASSSPATSTTEATATVGPTEAPTTVTAPSTTPAETTAPTTMPPAPAGWSTIDPATFDGPLAQPCCGSNWYGIAPSPALPAAGEPLADGSYYITFDLPTDFSQPVTATVSRFELCSVLPTDACEDLGGFTDDDIGVADADSMTVQLSIDGSIAVVLGGYAGQGNGGDFAIGNGADLAELVTAIDADYQTAVLDPGAGGADLASIVATLTANPMNGFGAPVDNGGLLSYTHNSAPPLLFQTLPGIQDGAANPRGSDVIAPIALVVSGGAFTITTYAGFYS